MTAQRILVVDDEHAMLRSVRRVLASTYTVDVASNAEEALAARRAARPDLAILDIRMPSPDGFALLGVLRDEQPDLDVIFMTGAVHEIDSQLIRAIREKAFYFIQKPFDREVLLTLVDRCLEQRRLTEENKRHVATLEAELAAARAFQRSLLPEETARIGRIAIARRYDPCESLGGDLVDYVDAGGGRAALVVADVSGHGVAAAMLTGVVKSAFHDAHREAFDPLAVVGRVAAALRPFDYDRFATLFCARAEGERGVLEYVNAGHPAPFLWGADAAGARPADRPARLEPTGPLVSPAFDDVTWERGSAELAPGDTLLVFTDGVSEARDDGRLFGEEGVAAAVAESTARGTPLLDAVVDRVAAFTGGRPVEDDVTLATLTLEPDA